MESLGTGDSAFQLIYTPPERVVHRNPVPRILAQLPSQNPIPGGAEGLSPEAPKSAVL